MKNKGGSTAYFYPFSSPEIFFVRRPMQQQGNADLSVFPFFTHAVTLYSIAWLFQSRRCGQGGQGRESVCVCVRDQGQFKIGSGLDMCEYVGAKQTISLPPWPVIHQPEPATFSLSERGGGGAGGRRQEPKGLLLCLKPLT